MNDSKKKNHNHFTHRNYSGEHNKSTPRTKKSLLWILLKKIISRPKIGPKDFDKLNPKPGSTLNARLDLHLFSKDTIESFGMHPLAYSSLRIFYALCIW